MTVRPACHCRSHPTICWLIPPNAMTVMSVKDGLPDAGTYRCTVSDGRDDSALKDVTVIVTADNKVGLYDNQGKVLK